MTRFYGLQGFAVFQVIFSLVFLAFLVTFLIIIGKSFANKRKNDRSPALTTSATVVAKRIHVWGDHSHTNYYATFQVPSGDRMELQVPDYQYGYLVEGDQGSLTFRGTRFLSFERT